MCGILFHRDPAGVEPAPRYERALDRMADRGPDARGLELRDDCALGHTRLSIIDLSDEANQPFWDTSGRHAIVYNGELYNYRELRDDLVAAGVRFRTASDTEVLLAALVHWGLDEALARVRGMFAFVWLDTRTGRVQAARDHFGQKPLYWFRDGARLGIASSPLSLRELGAGAQPDLASYAIWFTPAARGGTRGACQRDRSFFAGIEVLPAGHVIDAQGDEVVVREYFDPTTLHDPERFRALAEADEDALRDELAFHFDRAVRRHLVSDVPAGVLLSGGFDSTLVYWYAHHHDPSVTTFTKLSPGIEKLPLEVIPEVLKRRPASAWFGVQKPEEYLPRLVDFVRRTASPARWGGGVPMQQLCADARRNGVKVLLGGDCADEYMAGYGFYTRIFDPPQPDWEELGDLVALDAESPFYDAEAAERVMADERALRERIVASLAHIRDPHERYVHATLIHDTASFLQTIPLPNSDAYAMMNSVELRNPLLALDLVRFAINLPARMRAARDHTGQFGKYLMRQLAGREIGDFMYREKEGTRNYSVAMAKPEYWNFAAFEIAKIFDLPQEMDTRQIIRAYNLELFHRLHIEGQQDVLPALLTEAGRAALEA